MKTYELPAETKAATGFTHKSVVTHTDLTESTADTDQTIALLSVVAGDVVQKAAYKLVTAFSDASDAAFNDTKVQVGDGGDTDRVISRPRRSTRTAPKCSSPPTSNTVRLRLHGGRHG
jgi:hypothetical protein